MSAPAPPRSEFAELDRLIVGALADLRSARLASARRSDARNRELLSRAEANLDALLDYRSAARRR